jgi:hypothetical protein
VVGCARSDYCFELRNKKPLENKIVYFMIEADRKICLMKKKIRLKNQKLIGLI